MEIQIIYLVPPPTLCTVLYYNLANILYGKFWTSQLGAKHTQFDEPGAYKVSHSKYLNWIGLQM